MQISLEGKISIALTLIFGAGAGAAMMFPDQLWIGGLLILVSLEGFILLAGHHFNLRWCYPLLACGAVGIISIALFWWGVLHPIALEINIIRGPGNYPENYDVSGIKWHDKFSEARIHLSNNSNYDYTNINIIVQTDLLIWQVGINSPFSECRSSTEGDINNMRLEFNLLESGKEYTVSSPPPIASMKFRIRCDVLIPKAYLDLTLALVNPNRSPDKSLGMLLARSDPKCATIHIDFKDK